jgi:hypothetical protein
LEENKDIKHMVFWSKDQLDTKLIDMQQDVDKYAGWVRYVSKLCRVDC